MQTNIPPIVLNQILQIKLSPETIASLLNEAEEKYSPTPKHWNSKRVYPFWKACQTCQKPYPTFNRYQASRNATCSPECGHLRTRGPRPQTRKPFEKSAKRIVKCAVCGKEIIRFLSELRKVNQPTCSKHCNGILRGEAWKEHAHKGRAGWSPETIANYRAKITGPGNPCWRGGVTYFRKHGNYPPIKYVRCPVEFLAMARKDGYVMEHRLLMAQSLGRVLQRTEVVHHINHDPTDNRLENLMLFQNNQVHKLYEGQSQQ